MVRTMKSASKKYLLPTKIKSRGRNLKTRPAEKKYNLQQLIHPDYILFDWEFFSHELEFE